jgi:glycosyltransferase involved in cell wall biosynthesis
MTVAICTRNRASVLGEAIESVLRQLSEDTELLIVDNASTDGTASLVQGVVRAHPTVRVVCHPELGVSHARNRALAEARGRLVLFLDDDAMARDGWLEAYRRFFRNLPSPRVAAAGGRIFPRYEGPVPVWVSPKDNVLDRGGRTEPFDARGAPWASNFAVDRAAALQCGGFNAALGRKGTSLMAAEETDLCCRLRQRGHEVWWLPEAEVDHRVPAERVRVVSILQVMFCLGRSSARFRLHLMPGLWRRLGFRALRLLLTPPHLVFYLVAGMAVLVSGQITRAARLFFRSARAAGFAYELARSPE